MCGMNEDKEHMFVRCDFYGRLWLLITNWLGLATVCQDLNGAKQKLLFFPPQSKMVPSVIQCFGVLSLCRHYKSSLSLY
ncbi:transmembrane protein, putative [Medicago truncatula]|uniref:Transmembrane protein, putative n=1 Tax=Medicago truncatula TaxID=3880 RepID=G7LAK5_MEDTR|nr:transmembrane protein, putative [Medicago truncatula]